MRARDMCAYFELRNYQSKYLLRCIAQAGHTRNLSADFDRVKSKSKQLPPLAQSTHRDEKLLKKKFLRMQQAQPARFPRNFSDVKSIHSFAGGKHIKAFELSRKR